MMSTFSQLYVHLVWGTKGRVRLIDEEMKAPLLQYIGGVARRNGAVVVSLNSEPEHVHLLAGLRPSIRLSDLVRKIRVVSSKWINDSFDGKFAWQTGYGAFSVSQSSVDVVARYIENQQIHHQKKTFQSEYVTLLNKHNVAFENAVLWD